MKPQLYKSTCPWCKQGVRVTARGTLMAHMKPDHKHPSGRTECQGSGKQITEPMENIE